MKKRGSKLTPIGIAIEGTLKGLGLSAKYHQFRVWEVWDDVVGPRIAGVAQPERLDFDTLFVSVSDSMWLQQLNYLQQEVLDKLTRTLGRKVINRICFRLGDTKGREQSQYIGHQKPSLPKLSREELDSIDEMLGKLGDEENLGILRNIIIKSAALVKQANKGPEKRS